MIIIKRRDDYVQLLTEGDACRLVEQKEEESGGRKYDEPCGNPALEGYAGLCEYGLGL